MRIVAVTNDDEGRDNLKMVHIVLEDGDTLPDLSGTLGENHLSASNVGSKLHNAFSHEPGTHVLFVYEVVDEMHAYIVALNVLGLQD